ncbi:MAG: ArsR family transcriptional regulator [Candidatus Thorarchaeota archaeon]|nr:MAG: ArsR family transcriptional regulator [Candidatus Thorarchaeota archaeon]
MSQSSDDEDLEPALRGTTLRVYWFMLQEGNPVGVRQVQRALGMSSPSVASHHLSKLESLELVEKGPDNSYELKRIVKVGVLKNFVTFRGVMLPRYAFFAVFFTAFTTAYLVIASMTSVTLFDRYVAMAVGIAGAVFGWLETYRLWKLKFA